MPNPVIALPAAAAAAKTAKALHGLHAMGTSHTISSLSSLSLATILTRECWKHVPDWVKEDKALRNLAPWNCNGVNKQLDDEKKGGNDEHYVYVNGKYEKCKRDEGNKDDDEMASILEIIEKLQKLVEVGMSKMNHQQDDDDDDDADGVGAKQTEAQSPSQRRKRRRLEGIALHGAFLATIQLAAQIRKRYPRLRDDLFQPSLSSSFSSTSDNSNERRESKCSEDTNRSTSQHQLDMKSIRSALDYASWAYDDDTQILRSQLEQVDLFLLQHHVTRKPGYVTHYVAFSPEEKLVVVGVRGTSTLEDILTDCCGRSIGCELHTYDGPNIYSDDDDEDVWVRYLEEEIIPNAYSSVPNSEDTEFLKSIDDRDDFIRNQLAGCHEGILIAAKRLVDKIQPLIEHLSILCGYRVLLTGHSLGAGVASLAALILRSRMPSLITASSFTTTSSNNNDTNNNSSSCTVEHNDPTTFSHKLHVIAFASPPVLDYQSSQTCSPYVTNIVNNSDIIPRSSMRNLSIFLSFLPYVNDKLEEQGMGFPTAGSVLSRPQSTAKLIRKLSQGTEGDMLMTIEEVREYLIKARKNVEVVDEKHDPDHLYVPGRVVLLSNSWERKEDTSNKEGTSKEKSMRSNAYEQFNGGNGTGNSNSNSNSKNTNSNNNEDDDVRDEMKSQVNVTITDGTAIALRIFDLDIYGMVTDHLLTSHYNNIEALCVK